MIDIVMFLTVSIYTIIWQGGLTVIGAVDSIIAMTSTFFILFQYLGMVFLFGKLRYKYVSILALLISFNACNDHRYCYIPLISGIILGQRQG